MTACTLSPYNILQAQALSKSSSRSTAASVLLKTCHKMLIRLHPIVDLMGKGNYFNENCCHENIQRRNIKNKNNRFNDFS